MVEVDPRLFVTCRLCLDVQGHFQIDPSVQEQIKYCFDIDVEPFDRLPQLICKKCKNILKEYYAVKKTFADKQKELKDNLQDNNKDNSVVKSDSSNYNVDNDIMRRKKKVKKKRITKRILSDPDSECNESSSSRIKANIENTAPNEELISWETNFHKYYVCRMCSVGFKDKKTLKKHIKEHNNLHTKYKNVFKMSCLVVMEKCDDKPNTCNSNKAVVYNSSSIIQNKHNPFYYIMYHSKIDRDTSSNCKFMSIEDTSDNEERRCSEKLIRKRRRISSRSSSETVVLNQHSEHEDTTQSTSLPYRVIECIDLGDSSDNESYDSNGKNENSLCYKNKKIHKSKTIHNLIRMCHNRYTKQINLKINKASPNEELLQHKVLSIGRKIINHQGFNCTGLLRYLEYKDLSVIWEEANISNASIDGKYVRIATTLSRNENIDSDAGWINTNSLKIGSDVSSVNNLVKKLKSYGNFKKLPNVYTNKKENEEVNSKEQLPRISSVFSHSDLEIIQTDSNNTLLQKLLNENPVSNPKQLPKKGVTSSECYAKNMKVFSAPNTVPFVCEEEIINNDDIICNSMPIVASTLSLASLSNIDKNNLAPTGDPVNSSNNKKQLLYPKIKVKPVSELMPKKTKIPLNSNETCEYRAQNALQIPSVWLNQNGTYSEQQIWPSETNHLASCSGFQMWHNQNIAYVEQPDKNNENGPFSDHHNNTVNGVSQRSKTTASVKDCILLSTVEFPNTKTSSPFQYFQNLLLVHNITLVDAGQTLAGATCLIKLKLVYQQEKCEPITLCLSLMCSKNIFGIEVKDMNFKEVNINDFNVTWQWLLLNTINNNDVISKSLQIAGKASSEMFQYTKDFFNLLKSIKLINENTSSNNL